MVIQRKPNPNPNPNPKPSADAFIAAAPDAARTPEQKADSYEKGIAKGNKRQITLTIAPDLLRRVDEVAARTGQARAAVINMAIFRALEGDIFHHG